MKQVKYHRVNWIVEIVSIIILLLQFIHLLRSHSNKAAVIYFTLSCLVYFILSIVMYYSVAPSVLFNKLESPESFGQKFEISETELLNFIQKGAAFTSLFKLCLILIPLLSSILPLLFPDNKFPFNLIAAISFFSLAFIMFIYSIQYFYKARGFTKLSFSQTLKVGLLYYNPNDRRAVVDKQFGIGSTINLASKQGRLVLWVILAIPVTIITLLLIVLRLSGKL
jgi:uncharacterized membrane protein